MTLEELLNCSAEQLEAMSDEQLTRYFEPYFSITRPEQVTRARKAGAPVPKIAMTPEMMKKINAAAALGIDLSGLGQNKKRK